MFSMTGYGRATVERDGRQLTVELKSVNHRFLDLGFRMPRSFSFLEEDARRRIGAALARGHVDIFATYRNLRSDSKTVTVDRALVKAYLAALGEIGEMTGAPAELSAAELARFPDALIVAEAEEDQDALRALLSEALDGALAELSAMRGREGASLLRDLSSRVDKLEKMTLDIAARYPDTLKEYEARLRARIEELLDGKADEQRVLQEVAVMADRAAISEEIVRLKSHIQQMRETLGMNEAVGRKLDFIVQELNREVNTISSKSQDIPITQLVVAAKAEIEKMREQVQNIE